jgi:DNA-binding beta-propeller fold protein YncE
MWQRVIRVFKRVVKPLVPTRLLEVRRRRIRERAEPIYAGIVERLEQMQAALSGEVMPGAVVESSAAARDVLAGTMGRFEDVRFSPSGRRLALAAFEAHQIVLLSVTITATGDTSRLVIVDHEATVSSRAIRHPHGVAFIDEDTLIVASRDAGVAVFRLPRRAGVDLDLTPIRVLPASLSRVRYSPGSVEVAGDDDQALILVCDNDVDVVTAFTMARDGRGRVRRRGDLIGRELDVPDGIGVSHDGRWIAVSNHGSGVVKLFRSTPELGPDSDAAGTLEGIACPHGVRFLRSGTEVLVADAAGPWVHLYVAADGDWTGTRQPVKSMRVMDDATWRRGHLSPGEGGPKGIAIDPEERVLVTSCQEQPLGMFDLARVRAGSGQAR